MIPSISHRAWCALFLTSLLGIASCDGEKIVVAPSPLGAPSASASIATADPSFGMAADASESTTISATVFDVHGARMPGQEVLFEAANTGIFAANTTVLTDVNGVASTTIASTQAGVVAVTITINPGPEQVVLDTKPAAEFVWPLPKTYFVRATGTDPEDCTGGTSPASAWRTIGKALSCAPAGSTIYVGAGVYEESVTITANGTAGSPTRIVGDTDGAYTSDSGEVIVDAQTAEFAFFVDGANYIELVGLTLRNALSSATETGGVVITGDANVVRGCKVYENSHGIYVSGGTGNLIEACRISNNAHSVGDGIVLDGDTNTTLRNNLVYNNAGAGLFVTNDSDGFTAESNTFYLNGLEQIHVDHNDNSGSFINNIVANGHSAGIRLDFGSSIANDYNLVFGHGLDYDGSVPGPNSVTGAPQFLDPLGTDLTLGGPFGNDDRFQLDVSGVNPAVDAGSQAANDAVLSTGITMADCTTRVDSVLDGSTPDGATLNLGFHYPSFEAPLTGALSGDARLIYGEGTSRQLRARHWNDSLSTLTSENLAPPTGDTLMWTRNAISPGLDHEELVLALSDNTAATRLEMIRWTGKAWKRDWASTGIDPAFAELRGFDLMYEPQSGHALVVYSDGTATPVFRTWEQGQWSDETPLPLNDAGGPNPDLNTGVVHWVQLVRRELNDQIALLYSDANADLCALIWDGADWDTSTAATLSTSLLLNGAAGLPANRTFDGAFESTEDKLLVAWGQAGGTGFWWSQYDADTNTWTAAANETSAPNNGGPHFVDLAAEPLGDRIAGAFIKMNGTERLGLATWDGDAWVHTGTYDTSINNLNNNGVGDFPAAVAWVGTAGVAACMYNDTSTGRIDWARWDSTDGWGLQTDIIISGKRRTQSVLMQSFPNENRLITFYVDDYRDLRGATYDGQSWTQINSGSVLENDLPTIRAVPFSFDLQRP